jgi:hypothetical protein
LSWPDHPNQPRSSNIFTAKTNMKDCPNRSWKTHVSAVSTSEMAPDQQALFEQAVNALLAELVHRLDRRNQGSIDELERKSMAE